jgi:hypothetical protein
VFFNAWNAGYRCCSTQPARYYLALNSHYGYASTMNKRRKKKDSGLIVTALVWSINTVFFASVLLLPFYGDC